MKEIKLGTMFYVFIALFAVVGVGAIHMGLSLMVDDTDDQGVIFSLLIILIAAGYVLSAVTMLMQVIFYKGIGLKLSEEGVSDTLVIVNVFAFFFVAPVRFIPWDALSEIKDEGRFVMALVDTSKVKANGFAKLLLKIFGYHFCIGYAKPRVTLEDIEAFNK